MDNKTVKGMKASEVYRITAIVLDILEKAQFETREDSMLQQSETEGRWKMVFRKGGTTISELTGIREQLGKNFEVTVMPKDKQALVISIEASAEDFKALTGR